MKQLLVSDNTWKMIVETCNPKYGESVNNFLRRTILQAQPELVTRKRVKQEADEAKERV